MALGEVLAGLALVCGAPPAAGVFCAIAGSPMLAASKIAAMDPGVAVVLVTSVPFGPVNSLTGKEKAHRSHPFLPIPSASGGPKWVDG